MRKIALISLLIMYIGLVQAQWQEITKYGPVTDFLYINEDLQYIKGDTCYRVENGQDIKIPDWGFNKSGLNSFVEIENPADFVKGTLIGFKRVTKTGDENYVNIYKTYDGGKNWSFFASKTWADTLFYLSIIAVDTQTVFLSGKFLDPKSKVYGDYNWMKVRKKSFEIMGWDRFYKFGPTVRTVIDTLTWYVLSFSPPFYQIMRTTDGGFSWKTMNSNYFTNEVIKIPGKFVAINKKTIISLSYYRISLSNDSGKTWKPIEKSIRWHGTYDTIYSSSVLLENNLMYLKGDFNNKLKPRTYFLLKNFDTIANVYDSVTIKPADHLINTYDNKCFIYGTTFYRNDDPINHPLSVKENIIPMEAKVKAYFSGNDLEIRLPGNDNAGYSVCVYDHFGRIMYSNKILSNTGQFQINNLPALIPGIYLMGLYSKDKQYSIKLAKL